MIKYPLSFLILVNWLDATVLVQETTTTTYQKPAVVYVKQYTEAELRERERTYQYNSWKDSLPRKDRDFLYLYNMHVSRVKPDIYKAKGAIYGFHWRSQKDQDRWMDELWRREYICRAILLGALVTVVAVTATVIYKYDLLLPLCCFTRAYNDVYGDRAFLPVTTRTTTICTF